MQINPAHSPSSVLHTEHTNEKTATASRIKGDTQEVTSMMMMLQHAKKLKENAQHWQQAINPNDQPSGWDENWEDRFEDISFVLDRLISICETAEKNTPLASERYFSHFVDNEPAGLLGIENDESKNCADVSYVAAHPGTTGAGSILIEQAVNQSDLWNHGGRLSLSSLSETADATYRDWGFTKADDDYKYELNPAESDKWEKNNGLWQMKK